MLERASLICEASVVVGPDVPFEVWTGGCTRNDSVLAHGAMYRYNVISSYQGSVGHGAQWDTVFSGTR